MIMSMLQDNNNNEIKDHTIKIFNYISVMVQMIQFFSHMQEVLLYFLSKVLNSEIFFII